MNPRRLPLPVWAQRCIALPIEVRQESLWLRGFDPKSSPSHLQTMSQNEATPESKVDKALRDT